MTEDKRWGDMKEENIIFTLEGAEEYSEELYLILREKKQKIPHLGKKDAFKIITFRTKKV